MGRRNWGEMVPDSPYSEPKVIREDLGVWLLGSEVKVKESHPWGLAACQANLTYRCSRVSIVTFAESKDAVLHSEDFAYLEYFSEL